MRHCMRCKRVEVSDKFCSPCVVEMIAGNAEIISRLDLRVQISVPREPRVAGYGKNRTWPHMRVKRTDNLAAGLMSEARQLGYVSATLRRY